MKELLIRTIFGLLLGIVAVLSVWYLPSPFFKLCIAIVSAVSVWELAGLFKKANYMIRPVEVSIFGFLTALLLLFFDFYVSLFLSVLYSFYFSHRVYNLNYLTSLIFIFVYGVFLISTLGFLHEIDKRLIIILFATVWAGDTTAYFIGKRFGKRKLAPRLSPKKTWEGALGSFLGSLTAGGLVSYYFEVETAFIPVIIASILMQIGDLFESFIKRQVNVKDSSHLIPGHGGLLDRIDALIFASVVFYIFYKNFPL